MTAPTLTTYDGRGDTGRIIRICAADGNGLALEVNIAVAFTSIPPGPDDDGIPVHRRIERRLDSNMFQRNVQRASDIEGHRRYLWTVRSARCRDSYITMVQAPRQA
jgi:hypothetical protein